MPKYHVRKWRGMWSIHTQHHGGFTPVPIFMSRNLRHIRNYLDLRR